LNDGVNEGQTEFVELVVDYIVENGYLEREKLLESPFTQWGGI
jgi:type I restriction enzyme R subunit